MEEHKVCDDGDHASVRRRTPKRPSLVKVTLFMLLLAFITFVIIDSQKGQYVKQASQEFLQWVETYPIAGMFSFIAVYLFATVLFIPGSILTLGGGFIFAKAFGLGLGILFSTIAVFVGATLGSIASFLLGRYLFRGYIKKKLIVRYQVFQAIDAALESEGLKIMILLRLSPIIPFNAINYILGVTSVLLRDFILACFAMLPGVVLYTFLGSSAGSIVESASSGSENLSLTIVAIVCGVIFGVFSIAVTAYYAKKELNRIINKSQEDGTPIDNSESEETSNQELTERKQ